MDLLGDMLDGMFRSDARTFHRRLGVLRCFRPENPTGDALQMATFQVALCLAFLPYVSKRQNFQYKMTHICPSHLLLTASTTGNSYTLQAS